MRQFFRALMLGIFIPPALIIAIIGGPAIDAGARWWRYWMEPLK